MSKVRVYEVAKQLGIDEGAALTLLQQQGAAVRNRLSAVEAEVAERARKALERSKAASVVEERIRPHVVRRKATPKVDEPAPPAVRTSGSNGGSGARSTQERQEPAREGSRRAAGTVAARTTSASSSERARAEGAGPRSPATEPKMQAAPAISADAPAPSPLPEVASEVSVDRPAKGPAMSAADVSTSSSAANDRPASEQAVPQAVPAASASPPKVAATPTATAQEPPSGPAARSSIASETPLGQVSARDERQPHPKESEQGTAALENAPVAAESAQPRRTDGAPAASASRAEKPSAAAESGASPQPQPAISIPVAAPAPVENSPGLAQKPAPDATPPTATQAAEPAAPIAAPEPTRSIPSSPAPSLRTEQGTRAVDSAPVSVEARPRADVSTGVPGAGQPATAQRGPESSPATSTRPHQTRTSEVRPPQPMNAESAQAPAVPAESRRTEATPASRRTEPASERRPVEPARSAPSASTTTPSTPPPRPTTESVPPPAPAPVRSAPKTGIETWAGRPGVPMPQPVQSRGPRPGMGGGPGGAPQRRGVQYDPRRDASPPGRPNMGGGPATRPGGGRPGGPNTGGPGMSGGPRSGPGGARGGSHGRQGGGPAIRRPTAPPPTAEMSAHKKVIKIDEKVTLNALAGRMSLKATDVLMKLMQLGMTDVHINSTLDSDTAKILASEFGWEVSDVAVSEETAIKELRGDATAGDDVDRETRPPVVTVMGHVDHGKTSLLDYIRKTQVAAGEAGGITQHIGAYKVVTPKGQITFLDTPGHEAFTAMRARGASVTDIVILVVAADDGVMPQTREAVNHARAAKVPIVVAVNKVDKPEADPSRPRRELMELELVPEELGGETIFVDVSAKAGTGIETLLEAVSLTAEMLELKGNKKRPATGTVIEAMLDRGKGPVARILVRDGTLSVGDLLLAGPAWGKVRAMTDEHGKPVHKAGPSTPVEVLGLSDVPNAGDGVDVVKDARKAQEFAEARATKLKRNTVPTSAKISLEEVARRATESGQLELRLIIKTDVQGSVEAVHEALTKLSGDKVRVGIVHSGVGAITEGDVNLAAASKAIIIGFNVRPAGKASSLADTEGVEIRLYNIIYNAVDDVKKAMEGLLAPTIVEKFVGRAEVRQIFNISKVGIVAGSFVVEGTIKRGAGKVRLIRDSATIWEGKISGLKHIKEDKREVEKGFECGISLDGYSDVKAGDFVECYDVEQVAGTL